MAQIKVTANNYASILKNPTRFPPAVVGAAKAMARKVAQVTGGKPMKRMPKSLRPR